MDVESLAKQLILQNMTPEQQNAVLESVRATLQEARSTQKRRVSENVGMVVDALKKIEADIRAKYDDLGQQITTRVNSIKDGRDGVDGTDGRDGKDGRPGRDGAAGPMGPAGRDGRDGVDGEDGVSVTDAKIDFDGSLVITLSNGREINVGEVVAPDLAERIKVITNGGGTSQTVIDTLASLQTQINNLIPSQTGNSGKFLTTNGSALSWATVTGVLSYQGTWNASTNTPTLTSSVGTNGYYYVVSVAGSTNLNGVTDWQIGDWAIYNGTSWQKIDQTDLITAIASADSSITVTTTGSTVDLATYSSPRLIAQVRNETGATLTKGTVVYISGASGNKATVSKAIATSDSTSAQTFALIFADIANNQNGYAIIAGELTGLDTSAFTTGAQLYLSSTTAGGYTSTKQYAPNHLVYVGVVTRSHANQGTIEVRIQNGYEMDELHDVFAQNPTSGQLLIYDATALLWKKANLTAGTGIGVTNGNGSITVSNSGVTGLTAGTGISVSAATGSVTVSNTGVTSVTGTAPVASSGGATPAISLASGYGDTQNPYASKTANYILAAPNGTAGVPTFRAIVAADIPTLNQNTTGSAATLTTGRTISISGDLTYTSPSFDGSANVTAAGTLATVNTNVGSFTNASITVNGKGLITAASSGTAPVTSVTGTSPVVSSNGTTPAISLASGYGDTQNPYASKTANFFLAAPNGSAGVPTFRAIVAADIPTLNQNTTGTASNVTGTVAVANGGTGQTTYLDGQLLIGNTATGGLSKSTLTAGTNITITNGNGTITIASSGGSGMADPGANGVVVRTALNTTTARTITAGTGISVSNGDGVSGNPTITNGGVTSITGTANQVTASASTGAITLSLPSSINVNTTGSAATVTGDATGSTFGFNSGYGSVATAYGCRAWVNFNGTGTVSIRGSGNVTSITDNGVGDYTVNFTTAMPDANYNMVATVAGAGTNQLVGVNAGASPTQNTSSVRSIFGRSGYTPFTIFDPAYVCVSIFR